MSAGGAEEQSGNGHDSGDNSDDFLRRGPDPQNDASPAEAPGGAYEVSAGYRERWNLVSLPVGVADPEVTVAFPGSVAPLYAFRDGYAAETTAVPGAGYWLRFAQAETIAFAGQAIDRDTVTLEPGWNLIGSISVPVPVAAVVQIPGTHRDVLRIRGRLPAGRHDPSGPGVLGPIDDRWSPGARRAGRFPRRRPIVLRRRINFRRRPCRQSLIPLRDRSPKVYNGEKGNGILTFLSK